MKKFWWMFVVIALLGATLACGSSNSGTKVGEQATTSPENNEISQSTEPTDNPVSTESSSGDASTPSASDAPSPAFQTFKLGDVIQVQDHTIILTEVALAGNILRANFLIENTGKDELAVSSLMSFSAKNADGTKYEQSYFDCGTSLDGKVLSGDRLKGDVCWEGVQPGDVVKLYYEASLFSQGATVWEIDTASDLGKITIDEAAAGDNTADTYKAGDIIELQDHRITLNSAKIANNILKANFTIENTGTSDLAVSSIMSFYAKDPSGTKLEQEIFDCGSAIDGTVIGGDKVTGDICWKVTGDTEIKVYYEASLFGSGAVVWAIPKE